MRTMKKYLLILSALCIAGGCASGALAANGPVRPSMQQIINTFLNLAGTKPMTGNLDMGGHNIVNSPNYTNISSLAANAVPKGSLLINVKDYGAKGDGVTDDTAAIQASVNAAYLTSTNAGAGSGDSTPATTNGTIGVYLPPGAYVITNISLPSRTVLEGHDWRDTVLVEKSGGDSPMITVADAVNTERVAIKNLYLNGNKTNQTGSWDGIRLDNTGCAYDRNHTIENVFVSNCSGNGISLLGSWGADRIINTISYRNTGYGIYSVVYDSMFNNIEAGVNGLDGIRVTGADSYITSAKSWYNGALSPSAAGAGLYVNAARVILSNIDCQDNYGDGFNLSGDTLTGSSLLADGNGKNLNHSGSYNGAGFLLSSLTDSNIQGNSTNVNEGAGTITQQYGINFGSGNSNLTLFITSSQAQTADYAGTPPGGVSFMNGVLKSDASGFVLSTIPPFDQLGSLTVPGGVTYISSGTTPIIGAEMNPDPHFANSADWQTVTGWTVSGGTLTASNSGSIAAIATTPLLYTVPGQEYQVTITISAIANSSYIQSQMYSVDGSQYVGYHTTTGTFTDTFTATRAESISIACNGSNPSATITYFSVKPVNFSAVSLTQTAGFTMDSTGKMLSVPYTNTAWGDNVASASTITPTGQMFHVTGTTTINTINLPVTGWHAKITIVPNGVFSTGTTGNIANAVTSVVNTPLDAVYDDAKGKWYIK
jgi:hypothetical protein